MIKKRKRGKRISETGIAEKIGEAVSGLLYVSETDAEILAFTGQKTESVTKQILLSQTGKAENSTIEERNFEEFFSQLTEIQDWFGDEEKQTAQKFSNLRKLLQENLKDLKIFKVGSVELDVYAVGLDAQGVLTGIQTKAVET